jgi:DNA-binding transcriptional LysR family regulator
MELHQLKCFLAVVDEGGFNRATTRLHITQPALSYQIKQLEQELNARLFHRRPGGVSPTEAGRTLAQHAREVIDSVRKAQRAVTQLNEGVVGEIRIGTVNSVGIYFLPQVLWSVKERFPTVSPMVLYRHSDKILEALLADQVDMALVTNPISDRRLRTETIVEENISLVCGRSHPFFERKAVRPSELKGQQFVALSAENTTGRTIQEHLARMGVNVEPCVSTDNFETVKKMVEVGLGVAFLPDMVTSSEIACGLEVVPTGRLARIRVGPPLRRKIILVTWKDFEKNQATRAFMEELRLAGTRWKGCVDL